MPGRSCAVASCRSNSENARKHNLSISFHRFPSKNDPVSQALRQEWIRRCGRLDKFNPSSSQICSVHFIEMDFERDLQNELLNLPLRKILKKTAVPSLHLNINDEVDQDVCIVECLENRRIIEENPWKDNYRELLAKYKRMEASCKQLKAELSKTKRNLRMKVEYYRKKSNKLKLQLKLYDLKIKQESDPLFIEDQI